MVREVTEHGHGGMKDTLAAPASIDIGEPDTIIFLDESMDTVNPARRRGVLDTRFCWCRGPLYVQND